MLRPFRIFVFAIAALFAAAGATASDTDFLPASQAFSYHASGNGDQTLTITWRIAPDYYLYRHGFKFEGQPAPVASISLPAGKKITDDFFGESEIYHGQVAVTVKPGQADKLAMSWQGCAEAGLCYPPQHATLELADYDLAGAGTAGAPPARKLAEGQSLAARLGGGNTAWVLLVFFGLGLLLVLTPCVLPMLPILTSLIVGSEARGMRGFTLSLAYVLPMAVAYAAMGVAAALAGAHLQAWLQTPWVLGAVAMLFVALALAMFGVYELQLPAPLRERLDRASSRQRGGSLGGAAVMGVLSALIVGPCMTAPLAGALLYIADSGNIGLGASALFALGLGMGAPLVLAGSVGAQLLPRPGPWMTGVKIVFGFILLGMALWLIDRVVPAAWMLGLWGMWLIALGTTLYQLAVRAATSMAPPAIIARTAGLVLGLWGGLLIVGAAGGATSYTRPLAFLAISEAPDQSAPASGPTDFMQRFDDVAGKAQLQKRIEQAGRAGRWTLIDFYADWCVSCQVIEAQVFGNARVQHALADFVLLRPDVTDNTARDRALMGRYNVVGPPTILLIGPNGRERRAARIVGELDAQAFIEHLARAGYTPAGS